MTTSTESNTEVTDQVRQATEEPLKASKNLSQKLTGHKLPSVDLTRPVGRFFAPVQKGVDLNRNLATQGAGLVANALRHLLEQTQRFRSIVKEQAEPAADLGNAQAEREAAEREAAEREAAEREAAKATLEAAKRKLEAAKRKREAAKRTLEAAKQKREQAEREQAEREQAEREQAEREQAEREQAEREQA